MAVFFWNGNKIPDWKGIVPMKKRTDLLIAHKVQKKFCTLLLSHPTRGGWIEIYPVWFSSMYDRVPPHTGWVD